VFAIGCGDEESPYGRRPVVSRRWFLLPVPTAAVPLAPSVDTAAAAGGRKRLTTRQKTGPSDTGWLGVTAVPKSGQSRDVPRKCQRMRTKLVQGEYGAGSATAMPSVIEIALLTSFRTGPRNNDWSLA